MLPLIVGVVLFILGLAGYASAGVGYGLLLVSVVLLAGGFTALYLLIFTRSGNEQSLTNVIRSLLYGGGWSYVLGVFALSGYFVLETIAGRVELHWIFFGPAALFTLILFDIGIYKVLYQKNRPSWIRYSQVIRRKYAEPEHMRETLVTDVLLHSDLRSISSIRWLRHTLILWGFVLMFAVEIAAVFVREGIPAFGLVDIWEIPGHPVRLAFDFAFDFFGLMVLLGCLLSFVWRLRTRQSDEVKFADTPSVIFLFLVVVSGFLLEGVRLVGTETVGGAYSFVGMAVACIIPQAMNSAITPIWYFHVFISLAFIIYVPSYRLVHSCATPLGRLMTSQKKMLANKKMNSLRGLLTKQNTINN